MIGEEVRSLGDEEESLVAVDTGYNFCLVKADAVFDCCRIFSY
jgi:hypothetical protein